MKIVALFSALALGALTSAALAAAPAVQTGRVELTDHQMDKVAGGAPPELQKPGNSQSTQSCSGASGKCYYTSSNGKTIGKPVK
jgi:hypothetical protein